MTFQKGEKKNNKNIKMWMCEARYFSVAPYKMRSDIERTAANEK